ncbi:MAG: class I SAM-dependent methyltransferase [Armatimonadetes bacterium]|nr:class I SAM-dependent methyltransferase [Armatimonadota bacterium]
MTGDGGAWFETYFGLDYLRIYRFADTMQQLDLLRCFLSELPAGADVLDLPCGHGRHAVEVAGWGFNVTGLDLSSEFLAVAAERAAERGESLSLVRGDMRSFPFGAGSFDAAYCLFTSLGYFATDQEHQQVLNEFARVLRPGGIYLLDLANIDHVRRQPATSTWEHQGVRVRSEYHWSEADRRALTRRWASFPDGREGLYESSVRLFEGDEMAAMLDVAGLEVETTLGSYAGEPVAPERPRRIYLCRRYEG